jgi:alkylation response protein AidB-like acyl-CoA dehydrogenase
MSTTDILEVPAVPADFGFTEEHALARGEARRFLEDRSPITEVRRLATDEAGFDRKLFADIAKLGWIGLGTPTDFGGLGLDDLHLVLLMEEMGRVLLPSPYFGSLLALFAIERAGSGAQRSSLLPPIIAGDRIATFALSEPEGSFEPDELSTTAEQVQGGFVIRGTKTHVLFGSGADVCVVPCRESGGGVALFVVDVPVAGARIEIEKPLDTTRRMSRMTFDGVRVGSSARLDGDAAAALSATHLFGALMLAAEMTGGLERTLGITRDYAATRVQFGRPIGAFQAVKHPVVDMMIGCEYARSLAVGAAVARRSDPVRAEALVRSAKAHAGDAFLFASKKGVQLHGGFGFTWDCDVHFYFKRALWSRVTLGDAAFHRRHIARMMFDATAADRPDVR